MVTFRLAGSLPAEVLDHWRRQLEGANEAEFRRRIEAYLDEGRGPVWLRDPPIAKIVESALLHFHGQRYRLHAWTVMPNHVHVLLTPAEGEPLGEIIRSWKSYTAKEANRVLGRKGAFWQRDYFDRYIRDETHFMRAVEYIEQNPVMAGLCKDPKDWPGSAGAGSAGVPPAGGKASGTLAGSAGVPPAEENASGTLAGSAGVPPAEENASGTLAGSAGVPPAEENASGTLALPGGGTLAFPADLPLHQGGVGAEAYADAVTTYLAFAVDRAADAWSSLASWRQTAEATRNTFARQALPMVWDFAEANPFSESCGNWQDACITWIFKAVECLPASCWGRCQQMDATTKVNGVAKTAFSTDPPYYDNIGYADLSDFFYVWLRRALRHVYPDLFGLMLSPKSEELVATPYRFEGSREKAGEFFEEGLRAAFQQALQTHSSEFPLTIFYAFKQAENTPKTPDSDNLVEMLASTGWETMLEGLLQSGFLVDGTWPMRSERGGRMISIGTNALASSVVLTCRPRPASAPLATRREFLSALRAELPKALRTLQQGNIAPVDLAQAAIGPGMAVFSRYSKVVEADGQPMTVRTALGLINQALDEVLAEQEGEFDRDTRWAVAWFEQFGFKEGPYGVAETLSKAKNTSIRGLEEAGILRARSGKVRLLRREELADGWDPAADDRTPIWEAAQYLVHAHAKGEDAAAALLAKLGAAGEAARDLAYRLYTVCERKKWAQEALPFNALVVAWPEIVKRSRELRTEFKQKGMEF